MRNASSDFSGQYLDQTLQGLSPWEEKCRNAALQLGLGGISLSKAEAHVLRWLCQGSRGMRAVEIGTLTGLSGLYILDGLKKSGTLWTFEKEKAHAELAEPILKEFAQLKQKNVNVCVGDAREMLPLYSKEGPFDFVFIDGNKAAYVDYLNWAEQVTTAGSILVADNVFLGGTVLNDEVILEKATFSKKQRQVMREFNQRLLHSQHWQAVILPTVEGLLIAKKE